MKGLVCMEHRLFVYGTLRRGERNHGLLGSSRCEAFLARAPGVLVDTGLGFPAMKEMGASSGETPGMVCGEIYRVDKATLARIDILEDYHGPGDPRNLYERVEMKARTDRGEMDVLAYVSDRFRDGAAICFGDWKLHRMLREPHVLYFAYGSCMDDERFKKAGVADWFRDMVGRGTVHGCNLQFTRQASDGGRADMVETGGVTEGKLYRIPVEALEGYLYGREGVRLGIYRPAVVPVRLDSGETADALTFVVVDKRPETAPPEWYMEEILRGAGGTVSESYYEALLDRFFSFGYQGIGK